MHMGYETEQPMFTVQVTEAGKNLPSSVLQEIFRWASMIFDVDDGTCGEMAQQFECMTITVGHTPEEEQDIIAYHTTFPDMWLNVRGGRPVATLNSGITFGCHMELYLMPPATPNDPPTFEWTEP